MATPPVIACVCTCWRWRWRAFRLLFRGFNFRGSPVNRKNFRPYSSHSVRSHQKKSQTSRTLKISWGSIAHHNFPRRCGISCARYMKKVLDFPLKSHPYSDAVIIRPLWKECPWLQQWRNEWYVNQNRFWSHFVLTLYYIYLIVHLYILIYSQRYFTMNRYCSAGGGGE